MAEDNKLKQEEKENSKTLNKPATEKKEKEPDKNNRKSCSICYFWFLLFLITLGLFVYTQFYTGDGKFNWSLAKSEASVENGKTNELQEKISLLNSENEQLKNRIGNLQSELDQFSMPNQDWMTGESYEVNIGTFSFFNMKDYEDNFVQMRMHKDGDYESFTIGRFRDLQKAKNFREDIQRIGIEDAFIVRKVDGRIAERIYK